MSNIYDLSTANKEFTEAQEKLRTLTNVCDQVTSCLRQCPYALNITGTGVSIPYVDDKIHRVRTIDAKDWPTDKALAEALLALHNTAVKLDETYVQLSPSDKNLVNCPNTGRVRSSRQS